MTKIDQAILTIVCFALGIALGHIQATQWDKQKAERAGIECSTK